MATTNHIILFHGTGGSPEVNWLPWLKRELSAKGHRLSVPTFPTPEGQNLFNWKEAFSKQVGVLTEDMILVGHSMGVGMILRLLEKSEVPVRGSFLVAGWDGLLGLDDFDPLIESFYAEPFDYQHIRSRMGHCEMYHGDDDPYVPLNMGKELASHLEVELQVFSGGGHLNAEKGYLEFPKLLEDIETFLSSQD